MRVIGFCLTLALLGGPSVSAQPRPDPAAADSMSQKLDAMRERYLSRVRVEKDFRLSESEVNAYLAYRLVEQIPKGVEGLWVRFSADAVNAGGRVDLAALRDRMARSPLAMLLTGMVPIEVKAKGNAQNGVGKLELENVLLGGIEVPRSLLQQLLTQYSKSATHPDGVRLEDPFELPYGIRSARFVPGEIILRQGPAESQP